jgi:hypothetical protein
MHNMIFNILSAWLSPGLRQSSQLPVIINLMFILQGINFHIHAKQEKGAYTYKIEFCSFTSWDSRFLIIIISVLIEFYNCTILTRHHRWLKARTLNGVEHQIYYMVLTLTCFRNIQSLRLMQISSVMFSDDFDLVIFMVLNFI